MRAVSRWRHPQAARAIGSSLLGGLWTKPRYRGEVVAWSRRSRLVLRVDGRRCPSSAPGPSSFHLGNTRPGTEVHGAPPEA